MSEPEKTLKERALVVAKKFDSYWTGSEFGLRYDAAQILRDLVSEIDRLEQRYCFGDVDACSCDFHSKQNS